jgi:RNA polymerase sigma-70 factor (ECF subfamily)
MDEVSIRTANEAMTRYAQGEEQAFAQVYDLVAPCVYAFLLGRTRESQTAEDLLQQTFLQMHAARGHFWPGSPVLPWAFAIARRLTIDRARRKQHEELKTKEGECGVDAASPDAGPDRLAAARQVARRMQEELEGLPEDARIAFELIHLDGLSSQEAAQALGVTPGAVKMRAHRVLKALRERLGDSLLEGA